MFVRDFVYVHQPFEVSAPRLLTDTSWLAPIAEAAAATARDVAARLGDRSGAHDLEAAARPPRPGRIRCHVGPLRARADSILVALWLFGEPEGGFPDLTGDLEVAPAGTGRSLLALGATYPRSPTEPVAAHHLERATEAGVRAFLNGIATVLEGPVGPASTRSISGS